VVLEADGSMVALRPDSSFIVRAGLQVFGLPLEFLSVFVSR
jgi:hypothetical protein